MRPGVQVRGEKPVEMDEEIYTLSDYEEDGMLDYSYNKSSNTTNRCSSLTGENHSDCCLVGKRESDCNHCMSFGEGLGSTDHVTSSCHMIGRDDIKTSCCHHVTGNCNHMTHGSEHGTWKKTENVCSNCECDVNDKSRIITDQSNVAVNTNCGCGEKRCQFYNKDTAKGVNTTDRCSTTNCRICSEIINIKPIKTKHTKMHTKQISDAKLIYTDTKTNLVVLHKTEDKNTRKTVRIDLNSALELMSELVGPAVEGNTDRHVNMSVTGDLNEINLFNECEDGEQVCRLI